MRVALFAVALLAAGCSHVFTKIQPGMTSAEVRALTEPEGVGPSEVVTYPPNAQAWYYGEDRCILLVDDRVVQKNVTREQTVASVPGLAHVKQTSKALCAPPGAEQPDDRTNIYVPGVGGVELQN
ncbi:MAG: hypothetical protein IT380_26185 [Myxococcales bacterium]|nr:hypothetical protein [Myxococcales bacterium]